MSGQRITYRVRMMVEVERTVTVDVSEHDLDNAIHAMIEQRAVAAASKAGGWQGLRTHPDLSDSRWRADIMKREPITIGTWRAVAFDDVQPGDTIANAADEPGRERPLRVLARMPGSVLDCTDAAGFTVRISPEVAADVGLQRREA